MGEGEGRRRGGEQCGSNVGREGGLVGGGGKRAGGGMGAAWG